ncbi:MAG: hypothetical protein M3Q44_01410 [bacterium]|nr:hypothetical protein [bacterium]
MGTSEKSNGFIPLELCPEEKLGRKDLRQIKEAQRQLLLIREAVSFMQHRRVNIIWDENKHSPDHNGVAVFIPTKDGGFTDKGMFGYKRYIDQPNSAIKMYTWGVDE